MKTQNAGRRALRLLTFCTFLVCTLGFFSNAQADIRDPHNGGRPVTLDAPIVGFDVYGFGLTAGLRLGIPIVPNGFIPNIDNAVYINFGADFYWTGNRNVYGVAIGIPVTMHWEFFFTERWSAFVEVGINIFLYGGFFNGGSIIFDHRWFIGAIGGKFQINQSLALVLRIGAPYSSFGLSFSF